MSTCPVDIYISNSRFVNLQLINSGSGQPPRPRGIFVTGTDTGVGKTVIAAGLVHLLAQQGHRVVGLKPVASGAQSTPDGLRNEDALALAAASSVPLPYGMTNPLCFEPAIAPHLAARDAGVPISVDALAQWYERATDGAELAVVEGAGGWRVPLYPAGFLSDLPERLALGVVLVVGLRLGCLNHARLTLEAVASSGRCPFVGWIGNRIDAGFARLDDNLASLENVLGAPPLAVIPALEAPGAAAAAAWLDRPLRRQAVFPPR
jgi:dethiobiotin synthetase